MTAFKLWLQRLLNREEYKRYRELIKDHARTQVAWKHNNVHWGFKSATYEFFVEKYNSANWERKYGCLDNTWLEDEDGNEINSLWVTIGGNILIFSFPDFLKFRSRQWVKRPPEIQYNEKEFIENLVQIK